MRRFEPVYHHSLSLVRWVEWVWQRLIRALGEEGLSFKGMRIAGASPQEWDEGVGLGEPAIMLCRGAGAFEVQSHFGQDFNLEEDLELEVELGLERERELGC